MQNQTKANVIEACPDRGLGTGKREETGPLCSASDHTASAVFSSTVLKDVYGKTGVCSKESRQCGRKTRNQVTVRFCVLNLEGY